MAFCKYGLVHNDPIAASAAERLSNVEAFRKIFRNPGSGPTAVSVSEDDPLFGDWGSRSGSMLSRMYLTRIYYELQIVRQSALYRLFKSGAQGSWIV